MLKHLSPSYSRKFKQKFCVCKSYRGVKSIVQNDKNAHINIVQPWLNGR